MWKVDSMEVDTISLRRLAGRGLAVGVAALLPILGGCSSSTTTQGAEGHGDSCREHHQQEWAGYVVANSTRQVRVYYLAPTDFAPCQVAIAMDELAVYSEVPRVFHPDLVQHCVKFKARGPLPGNRLRDPASGVVHRGGKFRYQGKPVEISKRGPCTRLAPRQLQ